MGTEPQGVLTENFPSAGEMLSWLYGQVFAWLGAHVVLSAVGLVALLVVYLGVVVHRAVVSV